MAADGGDSGFRRLSGAPEPEAARVRDLALRLDEAQADAFAEPVRAAALDRLEQALAAVQGGRFDDATAQLTQARSLLDDLAPSALQPRRGLAGMFDSRNGRLKRFRARYESVASALSDAARAMDGRQAEGGESGFLDDLWSQVRDGVVDLDAHLAALAARLTGAAEADETPSALHERRAALDACREAAAYSLPLIRRVQNADARVAERLDACALGIEAWRKDWKTALGLDGKRPRRVRPDPSQMAATRDALGARIDAALAEITAAARRRAEVAPRLEALRPPR